MLFQDFQDGLMVAILDTGYWNGTNLAILILHVTQMPPAKFELNPSYRSGADMV